MVQQKNLQALQSSAINKIPNIPQCNTSTPADVPDPPFRFFEGLAPRLGGVTGRVLCTWWLLGLALKRPWLVPGGQPHALTAWTGLENTTLTLQRACYRRVLCTWWLLGLALKRPWLVPGGQPHALTAWTGLENTTLTLQRACFWQERLLGL